MLEFTISKLIVKFIIGSVGSSDGLKPFLKFDSFKNGL